MARISVVMACCCSLLRNGSQAIYQCLIPLNMLIAELSQSFTICPCTCHDWDLVTISY